MSSKIEYTRDKDENFSCGLLLSDIEEISKALYLHKTPHKALSSSQGYRPHVFAKTGISESKSNVIIQHSSQNDKKSSIWNWRPFKVLTNTRNHRFDCCFLLHVHAIEGLPPNFENHNLCVTWKRKADMLRTCPAKVCMGMAEFEETLMHRCMVRCSRTGPHGSAKYEPMMFLLRSSVTGVGSQKLDIGNHLIDLSRLLPLTLEELAGGSGKWTTSFKLTGKAKGAMLNVSFGFTIWDGDSFGPDYFMKVPDIARGGRPNHFVDSDRGISNQLHNHGSVPRISSKGSELSHSVTLLYQKLDEGKMGIIRDFDLCHEDLESLKPKSDEFDDTEFDVIEQGVEVPMQDQMKVEKCGSQRFGSSVIETIDVAEIFSNLDRNNDDENERATDVPELRGNSRCIRSALEELDLSLYDTSTSKSVEFNSSLDINNYIDEENYLRFKSTYKTDRKFMKSLSLDDIAETIENDFLNMLAVNQSPPAYSLAQFEEDTLDWGDSVLDTNRKVAFQDRFDLSLAIQEVERNQGHVNQSLRSRRNVRMLENLETEALMHEWGLNERAFEDFPHASTGGFGSPVFLPAEEPLKLPSIEEGVGPIIQTKDGFLRSMNPLLFRNANNGARLLVQVSAPVVLPAKMGCTVMEILQSLASRGVERMCIQINELMPLEDITGKTMQQVLSEAEPRSDAFKRWTSERVSEPIQTDYVSFENLVPMAITNIEGVLVEGLKIQSGMPDQEAPSSIWLPKLSNNLGSEGASDLQVLDDDEFIKHSLSLEEWMRLDCGEFFIEDETDETISKLSVAHFFNMVLKLQLRDPLRDYEMVGSSMLALVHVERVNSAPCMILEGIDSEQNQKKINEPIFKISDVHLAGLNILHGSKQLWGSTRQQQSGLRWLFSSSMARSNKNLISDSTAAIKYSSRFTRNMWPGNVLWSISVPAQGEAATRDEHVALNVHVRNPDFIFPNETDMRQRETAHTC